MKILRKIILHKLDKLGINSYIVGIIYTHKTEWWRNEKSNGPMGIYKATESVIQTSSKKPKDQTFPANSPKHFNN